MSVYFGILKRWSIWFAVLVVILSGCKPSKEVRKKPSKPASVSKITVGAESPLALEIVGKACDLVVKGDFDGARVMSVSSEGQASDSFAELRLVVDEYESVLSEREALRVEAYQEQVEEYHKLRAKGLPEDVNDIADVFTSVIKAREYADELQKKALLEEDFVKRLVADTLDRGAQYESEGNWIDSYAYSYYWLRALNEDNAEYKEHAEMLIEKASIEVSLKDNICESSEERFKGIRVEMLYRAVELLDMHYVSRVDYIQMASKGIARCRNLGEVILMSAADLPYEIGSWQYKKWEAGLDVIENKMSDTFTGMTKDRFFRLFDEVVMLNRITIELPQEVVVAHFSEGALESLDPHTTLVWPWDVRDFQKNMTQEFTGVGIQISKSAGRLKVVSLMPNTPAWSSDLDADDTIVHIDGEATAEMSIQCAVSKITGPKGTVVTLSVRHADSEKIEDVKIVRDRIIVPTIQGWRWIEGGKWEHMIDESRGIGYLRITSFSETTSRDMQQRLQYLEAKGMRGLIVDLRSNSGGYLVSAAEVVDMFVDEGMIVKSQPKWGISSTEYAHKSNTHPNYPIVVLINELSASASEIVSGALQDPVFDRATLVGVRSYGKGSVQTITPLSGYGSQLKYTMAYYHLPSDQRVKNRYVMEKAGRKDWGIAPDVEVKLRSNELKRMYEVQNANEVLANISHGGDNSEPIKRYTIEETLEADRQLSIGVLILRAKMLAGKVASRQSAARSAALRSESSSN